MEKLQSDAINELVGALVKAQKEITPAIKESVNPFHNSKYADLSSIWNACRDALNSHGLAIVQAQYAGDLITTLLHTSGQWMRGYTPIISKADNAQSLGSALTYARRYGLAAMVGVITEDDDGNAAIQPPKATKPFQKPAKPANAGLTPVKSSAGNDLAAIKILLEAEGISTDYLVDFISYRANESNKSRDAVIKYAIDPHYFEQFKAAYLGFVAQDIELAQAI